MMIRHLPFLSGFYLLEMMLFTLGCFDLSQSPDRNRVKSFMEIKIDAGYRGTDYDRVTPSILPVYVIVVLCMIPLS